MQLCGCENKQENKQLTLSHNDEASGALLNVHEIDKDEESSDSSKSLEELALKFG